MDKSQSIDSFWSSFNIPAYDEYTTPDKASLPYLTYEMASDDFYGGNVALTGNLWYKGKSWKEISEKADEIASYIGLGGVIVETDGGAIWIKKGTPFARRMEEPTNDNIRRIVLNIMVEFITN